MSGEYTEGGGSWGVRAALCTPLALEPPVSSEQEKSKKGGGSWSAGLSSLEDPCVRCRVCVTGLLRPPSLSTFSSVTAGSLCQRTDQSLKTAFLLRSVLEQLGMQLPARERLSPAGQEQEI